MCALFRCTSGAHGVQKCHRRAGTLAAQDPILHLFSAVCGGRHQSKDGTVMSDCDFSHGTPTSQDHFQHSGDHTHPHTRREVPGAVCVFCCTSVLRERRVSLSVRVLSVQTLFPAFRSSRQVLKNLQETCCNAVRVERSGGTVQEKTTQHTLPRQDTALDWRTHGQPI